MTSKEQIGVKLLSTVCHNSCMVVKLMITVMILQGHLSGLGLLRSLNLEMRWAHLRRMHQLGHMLVQEVVDKTCIKRLWLT